MAVKKRKKREGGIFDIVSRVKGRLLTRSGGSNGEKRRGASGILEGTHGPSGRGEVRLSCLLN